MSTVRDLISDSLRLIGALASGEAPSASEASDALRSLNKMLDVWSNESLLIFALTSESFSTVGSQQVYTMGPTGDFDTVRPMAIEKMTYQSTTVPPVELPIEILNLDKWQLISAKQTPSAIPLKVYPEYTNPLVNLNFWPIPSAAVNVLIYSRKQLSSFASINMSAIFPPGYEDAISNNLAVRLAPEYGKTTPPEVVAMATNSKAVIKRTNDRDRLLYVDDAMLARNKPFNWRTGE